MNNCLFCKIVAHEIPATFIYEDEVCVGFLDIQPVNKGHVLIVPKKHSQGSHDADPEILAHLILVMQKTAKAILQATGNPAYNLFQNNGTEAGQAIPHLHFHVIPRFADDGIEQWHGKGPYAAGEAEALAKQIQSVL